MKLRITFVAVLLTLSLTSCEKGWFGIGGVRNNSLTVNAFKTRSDNGIQTKEGTWVYTIESAFHWGCIPEAWKSVQHYFFYQEKFTTWPGIKMDPLVQMGGIRYMDVEYTEPGQFIDWISIDGLDESLGFSGGLYIPMNQGKYEGGNELIRNVRIHSCQIKSNIDGLSQDADIRIVITMTEGGTITLRFKDVILDSGLC